MNSSETNTQNINILIVDDTHDNLRLLSKVFAGSGYEVRPAPSGALALSAAVASPPDLILLDINMPGMDGFEVCERLKDYPETKNIPIIFISALGETFNKVKAFEHGGVDYITKPFQVEEVLARVETHVSIARLQNALRQKNAQLKKEVAQRQAIQQQLELLNEQLEERVKARTQELQAEIVERKRAQDDLGFLAFHDALTGLPNRRLFLQRLEKALGESEKAYAILFFDLDGFKIFNESLGHFFGDSLLSAIADRLREHVPEDAFLARLGGDEFAVFISYNKDERKVTALAEFLQKQLSEPIHLGDYELMVSASCGIRLYDGTERPVEVEHLLRDAYMAMFEAKARGKGSHALFNLNMQTSVIERIELERDLRKVLEDNSEQQLKVFYQPIIDLNSGQIVSFEALLRWEHPTYGWVSPMRFIPIAEETGLIRPLGWWVLNEACNQLKYWHEHILGHDHLGINVNLSALQLKQVDFLKTFKSILATSQINPSNLKLEITESAILGGVAGEVNPLFELSALGIKVCIDDFGTGYSSLSRLHEFPIATLKIDRAFVRRIEESKDGAAMAAMIIALAHGLGFEVVAEGIESEHQLKKLKLLSCESGQGYLFARPLSREDATKLLENNSRLINEIA